jgi:transcriptional regulator with XRE-family HTH domain
MSTIGDRLRELRDRHGFSREDVEMLTNRVVTARNLKSLERAPTPNPTLRTLLALQRVYRVGSIEDLLGEIDYPSSHL